MLARYSVLLSTSSQPKGIDSSERLGRRRWGIERTTSWLTGYRRRNHRYERKPGNYLAFLGLAAAICCRKRLLELTMQDMVQEPERPRSAGAGPPVALLWPERANLVTAL